MLADLRQALSTNDVVTVRATTTRLDTAIGQLSVERTNFGANLTQLDTFEARLADRKVDLQGRLSIVEDADVAEVFSNLANQETALQASLQANARIIQVSLLDFLR